MAGSDLPQAYLNCDLCDSYDCYDEEKIITIKPNHKNHINQKNNHSSDINSPLCVAPYIIKKTQQFKYKRL